MEIIKRIESELQLPPSFVDDALLNAHKHVKQWKIEKRTGGFRIIQQPAQNLKVIQHWLIVNVFTHCEIGSASFAFLKGKSIRDNALAHSKNKYFVKLDLKNFFPSLRFKDLLPTLKSSLEKFSVAERKELFVIIKLACFDKNENLPIGYPTSPMLANILAKLLDDIVFKKLAELDLISSVYTRYADDLVISSNTVNASDKIIKAIRNAIKECPLEITVNENKVSTTSSSGGSAIVTGLRVCHDGHVTLPRKTKDFIRLLLSLYKNQKIRDEQLVSLMGYLSFCRDSDPAFYTKLNRKFFTEIALLKQLPLCV
jgi:RNA-directed DNA polymerase